jgi:hypothetical protein
VTRTARGPGPQRVVRPRASTRAATPCRASASRSTPASGSGSSASRAAARRRPCLRASLGLLPPSASVAGRVLLNGCGHPGRRRGDDPPAPLGRPRNRLPGRDERAQPRSKTVGSQIVEGARAPRARARPRRLGVRSASCSSRSASRPTARRASRTEFSGWHAAASGDRDGAACNPSVLIADEPTTALDGDGAGADPGAARFALPRLRARAAARHARPAGRRRALRPRRRSCTRARSSSTARSTPSTTTRGTRTRDCSSRRRPTSTERAARLDPRSAAAARPPLHGSPVPLGCDRVFEPCLDQHPALLRSGAPLGRPATWTSGPRRSDELERREAPTLRGRASSGYPGPIAPRRHPCPEAAARWCTPVEGRQLLARARRAAGTRRASRACGKTNHRAGGAAALVEPVPPVEFDGGRDHGLQALGDCAA